MIETQEQKPLSMQDIDEYIESGDKIPVSQLQSICIESEYESEFNTNQTKIVNSMTDNDWNTWNDEDLDKPEDFEISEYSNFLLEEARRTRERLGIKLTTNVAELPEI
jgi:hypothetical protein